MEETRLKALLEAVESGSFSKAAEKLGYTQSGMTHMMDRLEEELGCPILERTSRGVCLTEHGEKLLPQIKKVLEEIDELKFQARAESKHLASQIKIGCFSSISHAWLPRILADFAESFPEMEVEVIIAGTSLAKRLANDELQLAFMDKRIGGDFDFIPLRRLELVVALPGDFPGEDGGTIELSDLPEKMVISIDDIYAESFIPKGIKRIRVDSADDTTLLQMAESGLGGCLVSELSLTGYRGNIKVMHLADNPGYTAGIAVKSLKKADPTVKILVNFLKEKWGE